MNEKVITAICDAGPILHLDELGSLNLLADFRNPQALFLTDDAAARLAAKHLGYRVHGSIGILLRAIRRGQLTAAQAISCLHAIPQHSSLHISPVLLQEIISRVKQEYRIEE